ncbi:MAG TPA: SH3 domain-containing protein [Chloroflexia bacterium]|nr:SH3 domain-containing protein [Chloroflexia bacterium]
MAARKKSGEGVVRRALLTMGISLLVVAGGSGTASAAPAYATPVTVGAKAVVTNTDGDPIRIREGAGTEYGRIAWAREGDVVSVLDGPVSGDGIDWFKIRAASATGWMMAQFLRGAEPATSAPAASASGPAAAPAAARLTGQVRVANTDGDRLRVRSAPNTGGGVIGYLSPDATGTVEDGPVTDSAGIVWYRISAGGLRGWCMAVYLAQAQEEASRTTAAPASAPARAEPAGPTAAANTSARPTHAQLRQWMEEARALHPYPDSVDKMWRVMMCESSGNPNAVGAGRYYGLFQYLPGTWGGSWNPYRSESIFDAHAQIFATARAWSIGMQGHWSCY